MADNKKTLGDHIERTDAIASWSERAWAIVPEEYRKSIVISAVSGLSGLAAMIFKSIRNLEWQYIPLVMVSIACCAYVLLSFIVFLWTRKKHNPETAHRSVTDKQEVRDPPGEPAPAQMDQPAITGNAGTQSEIEQLRQLLFASEANVRRWEFSYLNMIFARTTQNCLDWLYANQTAPPTVAFFNAAFAALGANERNAIIEVTSRHHLVFVVGGNLQISPKGIEYVRLRGPLPSLQTTGAPNLTSGDVKVASNDDIEYMLKELRRVTLKIIPKARATVNDAKTVRELRIAIDASLGSISDYLNPIKDRLIDLGGSKLPDPSPASSKEDSPPESASESSP